VTYAKDWLGMSRTFCKRKRAPRLPLGDTKHSGLQESGDRPHRVLDPNAHPRPLVSTIDGAFTEATAERLRSNNAVSALNRGLEAALDAFQSRTMDTLPLGLCLDVILCHPSHGQFET
jgi:hypothetical protein